MGGAPLMSRSVHPHRDPTLKLYTYFRSSAAYRVRIALNLKGLSYESVPIHMVREGGQQHSARYRAVNPQGLVPALELDGHVLIQSLAICEYLEERFPEPPLLPTDPLERAYVRAIAATVACEMHPLNNLRVLQYLTGPLEQKAEVRTDWYRHWIATGFQAIEAILTRGRRSGRFCLRDRPTLADVFLVPQVANALRFECPMEDYRTISRINAECLELPAFDAARPERQPDVEP
ncbi:MAG: maleylacetoacetate isomerase [Steroidobacteraceae bacterium]